MYKWSVLLGNLFEHYDSALFSLLSPFLAPLFFPNQDPFTALLLTYCIIPLGMIARPLGSVLFGYIGDTRGRKSALILSLSGMAIVTGMMGFLPTYDEIGWAAPICLLIGRVFQNFFAAGECMGGAIYLIEHSSESQKDIMSSCYGSSTIGGILLASIGVSILCMMNFIEESWRLLYFCGFFTALFAIFLRAGPSQEFVQSSNLSNDVYNQKLPPSFSMNSFKPIAIFCWNNRHGFIALAIASGFSYASYTLSLVVMNGFAPLVSSVSKSEMMYLNTFLLIIDFFLLPFFGILAHRFSREKMMIISGALALISGLPLFWLLEGASLITVSCIRTALVMIGVTFSAPFYAWSHALVPSPYRYTFISFGYAIGSQILGGPTAVVSLWLFQKTNLIVSIAWYWMALGLLASYFIAKQMTIRKENIKLSCSHSF